MSRHAKDKRPYLPPVKRIDVAEDNLRSRWIVLCILAVIAVASIGLGLHYAMEVEPGWNEIQANCDEANYASEFILMYDFTASGKNASAVKKELTILYSDAMETAYRIFNKDVSPADTPNLHTLSTHPNEVYTVDEGLYQALSVVQSHQNRCIYLAPVYSEYNGVFNRESHEEAMLFDPRFDEEKAEFITKLMDFIQDENSVNLELLGNNQVRLYVSEAYLHFAQSYEITEFLDFGWLRNAFVVDYVADKLLDGGFTEGYLASYDGYTRSLPDAGELAQNLFHRQGTDIYIPGKMTYQAPLSIVSLRDYPLNDQDRWTYHVYGDGTITSLLIDPRDGTCGTCVTDLTCYSKSLRCSEILLQMIPVIFADNFAEENLMNMKKNEIHSIWCNESLLCYNQQDLMLTILENAQGKRYEPTPVD